MTLSTPEENQHDRAGSQNKLFDPHLGPADRKPLLRQLYDAECESVASDYSEVSASLKDLESEVQFIKSGELQCDSFSIFPYFNPHVNKSITRDPGESDLEFNKRVRKINFLSLAQEFAQLKKVNAAALPFDLYKGQVLEGFIKESSPSSEASSSFDEAEYYLTESAITSPMESDNELEEGDSGTDTGPRTQRAKDEFEGSNRTVEDRLNEGSGISESADAQDFNPVKQDNPQGNGPEGINSSVKQNHENWPQKTLEQKTNVNVSQKQGSGNGRRSREASGNRRKHNLNGLGRTRDPGDDSRTKEHYNPVKSDSDKLVDDGDHDSEAGDFEVYNMAATLPAMDWETLEQQLALAAAAEEEKEKSLQSKREQIRQKLAMGLDEDYYYGERTFKKPNLQTRLQSGMNLQICFMNEAACEDDLPASPREGISTGDTPNYICSKSASPQLASSKPSTFAVVSANHKKKPEDQDFFKRQAELQEEATAALAQASTMARMQLQVERQMKKKSLIADMLGLPISEDGHRPRVNRKLLLDMNLAQLQVLVNDLHTQIETLNEELVKMLLERDDLHMEQDSMLVDIEDHTRRAQEYAEKINGKETADRRKDGLRKNNQCPR